MSDKANATEEKAWKRWSKQEFFPFVTVEERVRLAFLNGFRLANKLADEKEARKVKRANRR